MPKACRRPRCATSPQVFASEQTRALGAVQELRHRDGGRLPTSSAPRAARPRAVPVPVAGASARRAHVRGPGRTRIRRDEVDAARGGGGRGRLVSDGRRDRWCVARSSSLRCPRRPVRRRHAGGVVRRGGRLDGLAEVRDRRDRATSGVERRGGDGPIVVLCAHLDTVFGADVPHTPCASRATGSSARASATTPSASPPSSAAGLAFARRGPARLAARDRRARRVSATSAA